MFGRKAVLPVESKEDQPISTLNSSVKMETAVSALASNRQSVFKEVKENIKNAQLKQKERYDMKHCNPSKFQVQQ